MEQQPKTSQTASDYTYAGNTPAGQCQCGGNCECKTNPDHECSCGGQCDCK